MESKFQPIESKLKSIESKLKSIENKLKSIESLLKIMIQNHSDPDPSKVTSLKRHLHMFGGAQH